MGIRKHIYRKMRSFIVKPQENELLCKTAKINNLYGKKMDSSVTITATTSMGESHVIVYVEMSAEIDYLSISTDQYLPLPAPDTEMFKRGGVKFSTLIYMSDIL